MVNNFDSYKYFIGKVWKNIGINKMVNNIIIFVNLGNNFVFISFESNIINLFINIINKACFVSYVFVKNVFFVCYSVIFNLVVIN